MIKAKDIQPFLFEDRDFPRLKWLEAEEWIVDNFKDEEQDAVFNEMVYLWMEFIASTFDEEYHIFESEHFLLLTINNQNLAQSVINICESKLKLIEETLKDIIPEDTGGKLPILLFNDEKDYYRYISYYYPDEDYEESYGIALLIDLIHIALPVDELSELEFVLMHEIIHCLVADLPLPQWIDEGIAVTIERLNSNQPRPQLSETEKRNLKKFWEQADIQKFWSGESFFNEDDDIYSYRLAELISDSLFNDYKEDVADFIKQAHFSDAGNESAKNYLEKELSQIVTELLGEGSWSVKPETWDLK